MSELGGPDEQLKTAKLSKEAARDVGVVAKGGAVQIAGQIADRGLSAVFSIVAVEILGTAGYGLYRQVRQMLILAAQLGLAGFNYAAMRFITRARAQQRHGEVKGAARVALLGAGLGSLVVVVVLLLAVEPIAGWFSDTSHDTSVLAGLVRLGVAYVPLFAFMQVLRYCTQAYKTMVPSVVAGSIVMPAARFVLGVALLAAGLSVAGAVVSLVVATAIGAALAGWFLLRMLTEDERAARPVTQFRPMLRFALPQAGASLFGVQTLGLGIFILGVMSTDTQVGLFGVALSLQGPGNVFLGGIVNIWAPVVSDLHSRGDIQRLDALYKTINRWIATFSLPVFVAFIIEADLIVRTFFPKAFPGAVLVAMILCAGNIFYTATGPTGYVISMTGRPGVNFVNSIVAVAMYLGLGLLLVPEHGAVGMAIVDAIVTAVINTARVVQAKVLVGVQPFGRSFLKPVAGTIGGATFLLAWSRFADNQPLLEWTGLAIGMLVFFAILRALGLDEEEQYVWDRIRSRAFKRGRK
jgi:O-antigen/teichoic acid export membrane protein